MSEQNVEAVRRFYERASGGDFFGAGRELFHLEIEWEMLPGLMEMQGGAFRGLDEVGTAMLDWLKTWDWYRLEAEELIPDGDRVVALVHGKGKLKGSDFEVEDRHAEIWTLRSGKAVSFKAYNDRDEALQTMRDV